jgi:hypothetical protein
MVLVLSDRNSNPRSGVVLGPAAESDFACVISEGGHRRLTPIRLRELPLPSFHQWTLMRKVPYTAQRTLGLKNVWLILIKSFG